MVQIKRENRRKVYEYLLNEGVIVIKKVAYIKTFMIIGLQPPCPCRYRCSQP